LAYNDRGGVETLSGSAADARRIQNVLFGSARAGDGSFGLNVQNTYLMELADDQTISEIQDEASRLISTYCPGVRIAALIVEKLDAKRDRTGRGGTNTLLVGISLGESDGSTFDFALTASRTTKRSVVSTLVL
jgi:hypothetical protein